jgi:group I intron endonuclease
LIGLLDPLYEEYNGVFVRGIYEWRNIFTGTVLYGQSVDMPRRFKEHRSRAIRGAHENPHFQAAWNKYGESAFVWSIVEVVEDLSIPLTPIEQRYYESTTNRYNEVPPADHSAITEEIRNKISLKLKGKKQSQNHILNRALARKGCKPSQETKNYISTSLKGYWANKSPEERRAEAIRLCLAKAAKVVS